MKINRNYFWSQVFVQTLVKNHINQAVLCPGSRNSPLNLAFHNNPMMETFISTDERSAGFFAAGIARKLRRPVCVVVTSGTAVAELFPAVIESYQQRIPLLVITADRPPDLLNSGANQTINQKNLFRNCIRNFYDISLPDLTVKKLNQLAEFTSRAAGESAEWKRGPVQMNFPFKKPLEPFSETDEIEDSLYEKYVARGWGKTVNPRKWGMKRFEILESLKILKKTKKGIITCGPGNFDEPYIELLQGFSDVTGYPIFADAASSIPFQAEEENNIIQNFDVIVNSRKLRDVLKPDVIIHFGKASVTKNMLNYFAYAHAEKILISPFKDSEDPSRTVTKVLQVSAKFMMKTIIQDSPHRREDTEEWLGKFKKLNELLEKEKNDFLAETKLDFEGRIIKDVIENIPENSNLFLSNSTPIRDASFFMPVVNKTIKVYHNRGASGIDGIIASAAGIAAVSEQRTFLVVGDLAFLHDMNSLAAVKKYADKLHIILIDNNGGGVFRMLPISRLEEGYEEIIRTPIDVNFEAAAKAFGVKFVKVKDAEDLKSKLSKIEKSKKASVFYIPTDAEKSEKLREQYRERAEEIVSAFLDEN